MKPSVVWRDGTEEWWDAHSRHRTDGPAYIKPSGHEEWWCHGQRHREGGPAVTFADGRMEWWIYDEPVDPLVIFLAGEDVNG